MFGLGMPELVVILVIALLVFGAGRLPEVGSSLGKAIRGFKEAADKKDPEPAAPKGVVTDASGKFCPHCGKGVPNEGVFCSSCGKKISDPV
jgi:sec-independent protein translocase protein TatA